jgi:uncharacterized protein YcbX/ferredoxin-NADP reductase
MIRIQSLHLYPLKSGSAIDVLSARVEPEGLAGDRTMMVTDLSGECLTSRKLPALLTLHCLTDGDEVILMGPDARPSVFSRMALRPTGNVAARVWGDEVAVLDAGDQVADWLSRFLGHSCRLVLKGPQTYRPLALKPGHVVSFADTAPLLLIGKSSLDDLNEYLETPAEMARFRPNVVVSGALPFDEDGWGTIRIGGVEFDVAGGCDRCVVTTLDPQSGEAHTDREPLATLAKRRRGEDGKPYFGQFLVPHRSGRIFAGDAVEILSRKEPARLRPPPDMERVRRSAKREAVRGSGPIPMICTGIVAETADMWSFRFKAEDGAAIDYLPGQFITLQLETDGVPVRRNYTISSSPSRPHHIAVSVKRARGGRVSNWLHDNLKVGDRLLGLGPHGRFHLAAVGEKHSLLMVSAGSGITPMIAMLRYVADLDLPHDVVFHHSARSIEDLPFKEELLSLKRQMGDRLKLSWNLTSPGLASIDGPSSPSYKGRLDEIMLANICPDIRDRVTFCCGPDGFRQAVRAMHRALAPNATYLEESFGSDLPAVVEDEVLSYQVMFRKSGIVAEGKGPETLLDIARTLNIPVHADCEAGICGTCRCRVVSGDWILAANCADPERTVLSAEEKHEGYVLACSTRPIGSLIVDL